MMILVEERLNSILYADGKKPERKDRLTIFLSKELGISCWSTPLPAIWDNKIKVIEANAIIYISGVKTPFGVEGSDYLYVVSKENTRCISKAALFSDAISNTILEDIRNVAGIIGYDISDEILSKRRLIASATLVLKHVHNNNEQSIRIPYTLGINLKQTIQGTDYNELPEYYEISEERRADLKRAISASIQSHFNQSFNDMNMYSYNWFIPQNKLL